MKYAAMSNMTRWEVQLFIHTKDNYFHTSIKVTVSHGDLDMYIACKQIVFV